MSVHRVVIVGGGFGGLHAARALARAPVDVVLLDRRNFHLFQPLLYQVATGALSPANIAAPLRSILARQRNVRVLLGEMTGIDLPAREVVLSDGRIPYDSLILATGSSHHYFGHPAWEPLAPGLKTIEDATEIRRRVLLAFEAAERESDPSEVARWLTFVLVGGGPTGVELAGSIAEIAHRTLRRDFRSIRPESATIILVENSERILGPYPPELSEAARRDLVHQGVTVRTGWMVEEIRPDAVVVRQGEAREEIATRTVLWAAGVAASPVGRILRDAGGCPLDRGGRLLVEPDCSLPGHPEIFAIGDLANWSHDGGKPLPGVAQVAMQQGRYVARLVGSRLRGRILPPFRYRDLGNMATIGRSSAVAEIRGLRLTGHLAWLIWLFVHLMSLVQFQARVLVLVQWAWSYATRNRYARLITGESPLPLRSGKGIGGVGEAASTPAMAPASPSAPASSPASGASGGDEA